MRKILILATFDLLSELHLNMTKKALGKGEDVKVAMPTDKYAFELSGNFPVWDQSKRRRTIASQLYGIDNLITWVDSNRELKELVKGFDEVILYVYEKGRFKREIRSFVEDVGIPVVQRPKIRKISKKQEEKFSTVSRS